MPLYEQIAAILRDKIRSGEMTGRVPSIVTVAQTYEVGNSTAQKALTLLRNEGLIIGSHGRGYFVVKRPET